MQASLQILADVIGLPLSVFSDIDSWFTDKFPSVKNKLSEFINMFKERDFLGVFNTLRDLTLRYGEPVSTVPTPTQPSIIQDVGRTFQPWAERLNPFIEPFRRDTSDNQASTTININNPIVREDRDIIEIVNQVSKALGQRAKWAKLGG